jgi:hypothetical protein
MVGRALERIQPQAGLGDKLVGNITYCQLGLVGHPAATAGFQYIARTLSLKKFVVSNWGVSHYQIS